MKRCSFLPSFLTATAIFGLLLFAPGCDSAGLSEGKGTVEIRMTGASSKMTSALAVHFSLEKDHIQKALVTISQVSIVPAEDTSAKNPGTGISALRQKNFEVDLVDLQTGLDTTLATLRVPAGTYGQIRLITAGKASVTFQNGSRRDVMIASGQQTGLKLNFAPVTIDSEGDRVQITLHWDVSESLKGNARGQFVLTPVIRATVNTNST